MRNTLRELVELTEKIQIPLELPELVQIVSEEAARILDTDRVSMRLLDEDGENLVVAARFGDSVHEDQFVKFKVGEGLIGWVAQRNEPLLITKPLEDSRYVAKSGMTMTIGSYLGVPLRIGPNCIGVINAANESPGAFGQGSLDILTLVAAISAPFLEIARLAALTDKDPLTGVYNRRGLRRILSERVPKNYFVCMLDVDHFKSVNDTYGHPAGDEVLAGIASIMRMTLRDSDFVVRYGGEEFLFILSNASYDIVQSVAERIRKNVEEHVFKYKDKEIRVTVSIGIAKNGKTQEASDTVSAADAALYRAKKNGRNRIETSRSTIKTTDT
jgi:diguanylate cyclase (GGDEF)-like protein